MTVTAQTNNILSIYAGEERLKRLMNSYKHLVNNPNLTGNGQQILEITSFVQTNLDRYAFRK